MPLFIFVLAFNLARPSTLERGVYQRTILRLFVFGVLTTPVFIALGGVRAGWWPLNILFTLLILTIAIGFIEIGQQGKKSFFLLAVFTVLIGGTFVEFWWPAILMGIAIWFYARKPSVFACLIALLCCTSLVLINGNFWALCAFPIVLVANQINLPCPRFQWAFYIYYPLHLTVLWLIRIPMSHAGYLFFT